MGEFIEDMWVLKCPIAILEAMLVTPVGRAVFWGGLFQLLGLLSFLIKKKMHVIWFLPDSGVDIK